MGIPRLPPFREDAMQTGFEGLDDKVGRYAPPERLRVDDFLTTSTAGWGPVGEPDVSVVEERVLMRICLYVFIPFSIDSFDFIHGFQEYCIRLHLFPFLLLAEIQGYSICSLQQE